MIFAGAIYAWTIMRRYIAAAFPDFSSSQLSLTFTIMITVYCFFNWQCGRISRKISRKILLSLAGITIMLGYFIVSFMPLYKDSLALIIMYLGYGVISGAGTGFVYSCIVSGVSPWFPERLGLVSGLMLMGYGIGSLFLGLIAQKLCMYMTVFAVFRIFGVCIARALPCCGAFHNRPSRCRKKRKWREASGQKPR